MSICIRKAGLVAGLLFSAVTVAKANMATLKVERRACVAYSYESYAHAYMCVCACMAGCVVVTTGIPHGFYFH